MLAWVEHSLRSLAKEPRWAWAWTAAYPAAFVLACRDASAAVAEAELARRSIPNEAKRRENDGCVSIWSLGARSSAFFFWGGGVSPTAGREGGRGSKA